MNSQIRSIKLNDKTTHRYKEELLVCRRSNHVFYWSHSQMYFIAIKNPAFKNFNISKRTEPLSDKSIEKCMRVCFF